MNALHRREEERLEAVLQSWRAGIRITDTRRAVLSLFSGESRTSKRWEDLSRFIAPVSATSLAIRLQQYQGFNWWGSCLWDQGSQMIPRPILISWGMTIWMWCGKMWPYCRCGYRSPRSSWRSSQSKLATRSPRPRWPSMAFAPTVRKINVRNQSRQALFVRIALFYGRH